MYFLMSRPVLSLLQRSYASYTGAHCSSVQSLAKRGIMVLQNNPIRQRANRGRERVPLHQFLRMIAGRAVIGDRANGSNDELVSNLRRVGVLNS